MTAIARDLKRTSSPRRRQIFGLLDDDWTFPGPVLAPAINELISPPDEEELERRKEAAEKAKEEKFVRENELAMKKEQQGSIARRLKALSKPQQKHKPEAEEEYEEDEPVTDQGISSLAPAICDIYMYICKYIYTGTCVCVLFL